MVGLLEIIVSLQSSLELELGVWILSLELDWTLTGLPLDNFPTSYISTSMPNLTKRHMIKMNFAIFYFNGLMVDDVRIDDIVEMVTR